MRSQSRIGLREILAIMRAAAFRAHQRAAGHHLAIHAEIDEVQRFVPLGVGRRGTAAPSRARRGSAIRPSSAPARSRSAPLRTTPTFSHIRSSSARRSVKTFSPCSRPQRSRPAFAQFADLRFGDGGQLAADDEIGHAVAGASAVDDGIGDAVAAQAIGAMHAAGVFARREQAFDARSGNPRR